MPLDDCNCACFFNINFVHILPLSEKILSIVKEADLKNVFGLARKRWVLLKSNFLLHNFFTQLHCHKKNGRGQDK